MSKKDDLIDNLKHQNDCMRAALRHVGGSLGMTPPEDISGGPAMNFAMEMTAVIRGIREPGRVEHHANPRNSSTTTIGLAGGNLLPNSFDDMDEEIDRANATLDMRSVARAGAAIHHPVAGRVSAAPLSIRKDYPAVEDAVRTGDENDEALTKEVASDSATSAWTAIADIARELGIGDIEREFWSNPDGALGAALREIRAEILRIKNPSGDVAADAAGALSKGDTLGEAISHNRAAQQSLELELGKAREIIQRLAGAMQISQWDVDGTELVERAQRWDGFKHALRKSLDVWRARASSPDLGAGTNPTGAIVLELSGFLALLTSHSSLAAWLKNKPKVASDALLSVASDPPLTTFSKESLSDIVTCLHATEVDRAGSSWTVAKMTSVMDSSVASAEFVNLMNLVILPILARQGA